MTARRAGVATALPSTAEVTRLRARVEDLQAAVTAIRTGGIDAIMVGSPTDEHLYTLTNADRPYRVIVEELGEAAATVSERGVLLYANTRLAELTGRDRADVAGTDITALIDPPDRCMLEELLACAPGDTRRGELHLAGPDGIAVPVLTSVTGLEIDGVLVRCLIATDLTARRRHEQLILEANAVIAAHVAELEQANLELTRSNEDLAQFAYAASHDLSEPLRSISGFADLLRVRYHGSLDTDADAFLDFISAGTARMQRLIDDLLAYSRVTTRALPLTPVDLRQVLDTVLAHLKSRLGDTGALVRIDTTLPVLAGDAIQLTQVFTNLIRNAITFTTPGTTPDVHVSADRDGPFWRFTVADNGIGIPPEHRERVFGMFKRLHSRDAYPGTGVGLAVVRKIVHRHGGTITITDNPGGGTRISFTIPATAPAATTTPAPAPAAAPGNVPDPQIGAAGDDPDRWMLR